MKNPLHPGKVVRVSCLEPLGFNITEGALQTTCDTICTLKERYENIGIDDHSRVFNTDLVNALELGYMLDVAERTRILGPLATRISRLSRAIRTMKTATTQTFSHTLYFRRSKNE